MKCTVVREMYGLPENDPRYARVQAHLLACYQCRARWDDQDTIRQLIALKRYEQPAPGLEARSLAAIRRRLAAPPEPASWWRDTLAAWYIERFRTARLALAAAAALLVLLGGGYYLVRPSGSSAPGRPAPAVALESRILIQPPDTPALTLTGEPPMAVASSNLAPARVDYGPGAAVPVNYNY